jgi:23S rRNA (cytosine1962-C5)-methyltransferase
VTFAFSVAGLIIKPRARIFHGHDWVYASEILKTFGNPVAGEVVSLKDGKDRLIGSAIYNPASQIVARRFSRRRQDLDAEFFRRRIALAIDYRRRRGIDPRLCRLVWSESDGLPGLIVDRYGDCLVLQTLTTAMDQRKTLLTEVLVSLLAPAAVIERNDAPIRRAEGLELTTGLLHGEAPGKIEIEFGGLFFAVDLLHGQKTGFYLDQIENYQRVAAVAHGRRVLDCFSNQGAFALACARQGAASVLGVEVSAEAVATARGNVERNALAGIEWQEANVFDFLPAEERRGAQYDLIILDPPSFTKSKSQLGDALRGYKEIHLRALKLLSQDGLLATFCCSHHVSATEFREMLIDASVDARRAVRQIGRFTQAADHPVVPTLPETEYLQGYLLEAMPAR